MEGRRYGLGPECLAHLQVWGRLNAQKPVSTDIEGALRQEQESRSPHLLMDRTEQSRAIPWQWALSVGFQRKVLEEQRGEGRITR